MHKTLCLFLFSVCCHFHCRSQASLSVNEKCWALFHPIAALKVNKIGKQATHIYNDVASSKQLDAYSNGGQLDAFRHVFYMAAFAQKVKPKKIRKLGIAHEKANYRQFKRGRLEEGEVPDSLSSVMDLSNNEAGLRIGSQHKATPLNELKKIILEKILAGEALIMSRNKKGEYLDCSNRVLQQEQLRQWNVPKCLVSSALRYKD